MRSQLFASGNTFSALRSRALLAGMLAATCGLAACGSDSKETTPTTGTTTGTTAGGTSAGTTTATSGGTTAGGTTTAGTTDCTLTHTATLSPTSEGVSMTSTTDSTAAATSMKYLLFVANPNAGVASGSRAGDSNKTFAVSMFDYDYCDFSYDRGYAGWPINGFTAASVYLVDTTPGASLSAGDYTLDQTAQRHIYIASGTGVFGSGVTKEVAGKAVGGGSCGATYPTFADGTKVTLTTASVPNTDKNSVAGITGSVNLVLNDSTTISGSFSSGTCSTSNPSPPSTIDACSCSLGSTSSAAAAPTTTTTTTP